MSLTYTSYVAQLANLMVQVTTDPNFVTFLPGCIDYAEQRIYRELDLQATRTFDATDTLSSGDRTWTLPILSSGPAVCGGTVKPLCPGRNHFLEYHQGSLDDGDQGVSGLRLANQPVVSDRAADLFRPHKQY